MDVKWNFVRLFVTLLSIHFVSGEDFFLEYFVNVTMDCDDTKHNFTSTSAVMSRSWLLPSGDIISDSDATKRFVDKANSTLTVRNINDPDFGYYYCLIVRNDFTVDRIRHGLNVDGPSFGNLLSEYKNNAVRGAIAAAVLFASLTLFCLVWNLRYYKRDQKNKAVDKLDHAIGEFDLKSYENVGLDTDVKLNGEDLKKETNELDNKL